MFKQNILVSALLLIFSAAASAGVITYGAVIDTSSLAGSTGSLDLNFNPGPLVTQAGNVGILNFASNGTVSGSVALTGDVTGALPSNLAFDNETGFNDYFQAFTFGSSLSFDVSLYGPELASPDGISSSGSTFAFSLFSDAAGTVPALTSDSTNGFGFLIGVNLDGSTTLTNYLTQGSVTPVATGVPEPGTAQLLTLVFLFTSWKLVVAALKGWLRHRECATRRTL